MKDLDLKQNVLKEIISLMDKREGEELKKHPKFMKAEVEIEAKPLGEEMPEGEELPLEVEGMEAKEPMEGEESKSELSEEDIQMLLEKLKDLE